MPNAPATLTRTPTVGATPKATRISPPAVEIPPQREPHSRQALLQRVEQILACPECRAPLAPPEGDEQTAELRCPNCGPVGMRKPNQLCLGGFTQTVLRSDWLNRAKESAKRLLGKLYPLAIEILSPVHMRREVPRFLKSFDTTHELVADLGSGTSSYQDRVVCVDGGDYANVHVTADLAKLPFRDESLSGIVSVAVLEHVPNPAAHVREFLRVLKPGGRVLCYIPFMQGYHASPNDYQRYTLSGMKQLFAEFTDLEVTIGAGPTSGFIWTLQEWLALVLSFGSRRLYRLVMPLTWILSPLKYLDLLLNLHPDANVIASAFFIKARKR